MIYRVPFGTDELAFDLPWSTVDVAESALHVPPTAPETIRQVVEAFAHQIIAEANPQFPLIIVFTDATRASPDQTILEPMLRILQNSAFSITLLCATGMHRPSTRAEKIAKLGEWIVSNFQVIDHDPKTAVNLGEIDGVPVEINPLLLNAIILSVGVVEPHQYAGYSGGTKTAVIGCAGAQTISITHGPEFLDKSGTRLANMNNNPFQNFLRKAGAMIGHKYAVNVVMDTSGQIVQLEVGAPEMVHDRLVTFARSLHECPVPNTPYDVVIAGVGAPKDANLYQASRAATYIGLSGWPVLRDNGIIIVPALLPENEGQGVGEQYTYESLKRFGATQTLIDHYLKNGCRAGEQRAFMIAQLMQRYHVIWVGVQNPTFLDDIGFHYASTISKAVQLVEGILGEDALRTLIVPDALKTIPRKR